MRDEQRLKAENAKKPKQNKKYKKRPVPRTVQKSMPYQKIADDAIIRVDDNHYSKTYRKITGDLLKFLLSFFSLFGHILQSRDSNSEQLDDDR